jgi:Na+-driven multidrug efflux pump
MAMTFFPAIGKGKPAIIIGLARQLVLYVPVMLILPRLIGVAGIYYGSFLIDVIIAFVTVGMIFVEFRAIKAQERVTAH